MAPPNWLQQIVDRAGLELTLLATAPGSDSGQVAIPVRVISQLGAGGGGGGAPTDADYVVGTANATLTAELVLGSAVIMRGTAAARPAASLNGRLYYVTDSGDQRWTRDTGTAWEDAAPHYSELLGTPATFAPSAHATSHQHGGADEVATATPAANAIPKAGAAGTLATGWHPVHASGDLHTEYLQEALVDAKGDLLVATAADTPARLAVGTDTHVLTADSAQATGVKWAAAPGGSATVQDSIELQADAGTAWTNMPSAETELNGNARARWKGDLSWITKARFQISFGGVTPVSGAIFKPQYSTDGSTWNDIVAGLSITQSPFAANTFYDSGWQGALPAGMKVDDVFLRVVGSGGDGVVDPNIATVRLIVHT